MSPKWYTFVISGQPVEDQPYADDALSIAESPDTLLTQTSMEERIAEHVAAPIPPTSPAYDQAPLVHRTAMIRMRDDIPEEDMPPQRRFVLTTPSSGCDVA
nr:hypothetical protein [Tanacetum cinerariifolium]